MIENADFCSALAEHGVNFFAGVPDSLLKDFSSYVVDSYPADQHVIAANEGAAVAMAVGHHLATGEIPLVYMQNSGIGNAVNPLLSLADREVYAIPLVFLIGWRGEPGSHDEPQHVKQGRIQTDLLRAIDLPHVVIGPSSDSWQAEIDMMISCAVKESRPVAIVVEKGAFNTYETTRISAEAGWSSLSREKAIESVVDSIRPETTIVCTTGKASRELFELREKKSQSHASDFLTVGSMGHSSQIALGISLAYPDRHLVCIDGDGAVLMHMGSLAVIGQYRPKRFVHIVLNNRCHDSVGGQPTPGAHSDFPAIARACGYVETATVDQSSRIERELQRLQNVDGPALLEIRVTKGARSDLGRPTVSPGENKVSFMSRLAAS